jgi:hypothetical protein
MVGSRMKIMSATEPGMKFLLMEVTGPPVVSSGGQFYRIPVKWVIHSGYLSGDSYVSHAVGGVQGPRGTVGLIGPAGGETGPVGPTGPAGTFGGASFRYTFDTDISDTDPGDGDLKFNGSDISLATALYIDDKDMYTNDIQAFLRTIDDSTSTIKGHLKVSEKDQNDNFVLFAINSYHEHAGWFDVDITYIDGSVSVFPDGEDIYITFARVGDKGDGGPTGPAGPSGPQGADGAMAAAGKIYNLNYRIDAATFGGADNVWYDTGNHSLGVGYYPVVLGSAGTEYVNDNASGVLDARGDIYTSGNIFAHERVGESWVGDIGTDASMFGNIYGISGHFTNLYRDGEMVAIDVQLKQTGQLLSNATGILSDATGNLAESDIQFGADISTLQTEVVSNDVELATVVHLSGIESITGQKTFESGVTITGSELSIRNSIIRLDGSTSFSGNIVPNESGEWNIGSETKPFKDLYLERDSLKFMGGVSIGVSNDGTFKVKNTVTNQIILEADQDQLIANKVRFTGEANFDGDMSVAGIVTSSNLQKQMIKYSIILG